MAKEAESQVLRIVEENQKKEEGMTFWQRMFSVGGGDKNSLTEQKNVLIYLSASIKNLTNMFQVRYSINYWLLLLFSNKHCYLVANMLL